MTRQKRKQKSKTNLNLFSLLQSLLISVGKPFFWLIEYSLIGFLLLISKIGHAVNWSISSGVNIAKNLKLPKRVKTKKKIFKLPSFPKIHLPKLPKFKIKKKLRKAKKRERLSFLSLFSLVFVFIIFLGVYVFIFKDLPSPLELTTRKQEISTKIYDRNGILLYKIYKDKNRTPVKLQEIPIHVRLATLAAEDAEFYSHPGFSIKGITRSIYRNATEGELAGGSTITQQLVKNALLSSEKTLIRKLREIILSIETEIIYSKDEILEMYLNEVSYGGSAYGIEEASEVYFGKTVKDLSIGEAALLAGLPKSPTRFSPFGSNPEIALARQKDVLRLMVINKYLSQEEVDKAEAEKLLFADNRTDIKAPHFVMHVREKLVEKYGE